MSSSMWTRLAHTCFIRPRVGSGPVLGRSYIVLAAKPTSNIRLRSIPLITRRNMSATALHPMTTENAAPLPPVEETTEKEEELPEFLSLRSLVNVGILRALTRAPFNLTTMSPVQAAVLPLLPDLGRPYDPENPPTSPRDLLVKAKTGTGKTLAFLIPAVEARLRSIDENVQKVIQEAKLESSPSIIVSTRRKFMRRHTGVVIISPTRELATQIANEARKLVSHIDLEVHLFVGGERKGLQLRDFRRGSHDIIVATPGRLNDILESDSEVADSVAHAQTLILDEADTLLDMGFAPDILAIQKYMPPSPQRQTFLFSATLSRAIREVARKSLAKEHHYINCASDNAPPTHPHIPQFHTVLPSAEHQFAHIVRTLAHDQLANPGKSKIIVFLPTTKMTQLFAALLREVRTDTMPAGANTQVYEIHSKKSMESRTRTSKNFREDKFGATILVTSDVSARGVDYPGVTRVVQVGIPSSGEQYVHRVGRTGRAGTQGRGDLLLLPWELNFVSSQIGEVPLKPLTMEDLTKETLELAKSYDADPTAFWGGEIPSVKSNKSYLRSRTLFRSASITPVIEDIPRKVSETVAQANEDAVVETFTSLLGYYVGKTGELQLSRMDILERCKDWAVQACGLPSPPNVPRMLLEKLGIGNEAKMDRVRRSGFREPRQNAWSGRGQQRLRNEFGRGRQGRDDGERTDESRGGWGRQGRDVDRTDESRGGWGRQGRDVNRTDESRGAWGRQGRDNWGRTDDSRGGRGRQGRNDESRGGRWNN